MLANIIIEPNPCQAETSLSFTLFQPASVKFILFTIDGKEINNGIIDFDEAGEQGILLQTVDKTGQKLEPGIYFIKLISGQTTKTRMLIID